MIKKCVGVILYDDKNRIFLMNSPKWNGYVVPGGKIEKNETEEEALIREIKEELGIEINNIQKIGEFIKKPSSDFQDNKVTFHFIDFFARALETNIKPNEEILKWGWFTFEEALKLPLVDSTRRFVNKFIESQKKNI